MPQVVQGRQKASKWPIFIQKVIETPAIGHVRSPNYHLNGSWRGLASKLGLSKSTVAEQLVKAESEIVGGFLESSR